MLQRSQRSRSRNVVREFFSDVTMFDWLRHPRKEDEVMNVSDERGTKRRTQKRRVILNF